MNWDLEALYAIHFAIFQTCNDSQELGSNATIYQLYTSHVIKNVRRILVLQAVRW